MTNSINEWLLVIVTYTSLPVGMPSEELCNYNKGILNKQSVKAVCLPLKNKCKEHDRFGKCVKYQFNLR